MVPYHEQILPELAGGAVESDRIVDSASASESAEEDVLTRLHPAGQALGWSRRCFQIISQTCEMAQEREKIVRLGFIENLDIL